jgi:membrane-associated phospholipid phosphatase
MRGGARRARGVARAVLLVGVVVGGVGGGGASAGAQESPLEFFPKQDAQLLSFGASLWITGQVVQPYVVPTPSCGPCVASDVNPLDRGLAGRRDSVADAISYGTAALTLVAPLVADGIDVRRNGGGWRAWGIDSALLVETLAITGAVNQWVKVVAHRPRPYVYGLRAGDEELASSESFVSFFSEHSSLTFAAAAFYTTLFALRHPQRRALAAGVGVIAFGLAALTASLRVVAGKHFYTDVLTGALFGSAVGVAVPFFHRRGTHSLVAMLPSIATIDHGAIVTLTIAR